MEPFSIAKRFQTSKNTLEALKTLRLRLKLRKLFEKSLTKTFARNYVSLSFTVIFRRTHVKVSIVDLSILSYNSISLFFFSFFKSLGFSLFSSETSLFSIESSMLSFSSFASFSLSSERRSKGLLTSSLAILRL